MTSVLYRDLNATPPEIVRGSGVFLEDSAGKRYLDGSGSAGVVGIGHGRTEIARALAEAGDRVTFVYGASFTHPWQERLAEALLSIAPPNMAAAYFVSGGSEANETALKLARQYFLERGKARKYKAIARWQSYHGVTLATLALSGRTSWRSPYAPMLMPVTHIAAPYRYRCAFCAASDQCSLACADELERAILLEGPEEVAVFFAEPVSGTTATGLVPHDDYYRRVRAICDRYDVLFVADEVLSGYGRTGAPFAISAFGVEPDIITMGKALGSGYAPIGAALVSAKVREAIARGSGRFNHGLTFSGCPSACFAALKVFEIMQREDLFHRPAASGQRLRAGLEALAQKYRLIGEVRGRGLLQGIEFVADRASRQPIDPAYGFTARLGARLRERGLIVGLGVGLMNHGRDGDHIQLSPPFVISHAEIDQLLGLLDEALDSETRAAEAARVIVS